MKGSFSAAFTSAMSSVKDATGPSAVDTTVKDAADVSNVADDEYEVEYTMQTGPTRYAPMQPVPPTKITAKQAKPLYPTSSVKLATTKLPIPSVQTTITQSQTHKVTSIENTVRGSKGDPSLWVGSWVLADANMRNRSRRLPCLQTTWPSF